MAQLLVITGPTACGKTKRAVECANFFGGEIISADSRQIYRGMDIGTGKDLAEYGDVPYHMIDICDAGYKYNLYEYLRDASAARAEIEQRGKLPILCGGTGLYVESMLNGLRLPEVPANEPLRRSLENKSLEELTRILSSMKNLHNVTDVDTAKRAIRAIEIQQFYADHPDEAKQITPDPEKDAAIVGIQISREDRRNHISSRLSSRLSDGMEQEVKQLIDSGVNPENLIYYGLEYKFMTLYVTGRIQRDEALQSLEIAIHQFAKRQMTWFRGMERRGWHIDWLPWDMPQKEFVEQVADIMRQRKNNAQI